MNSLIKRISITINNQFIDLSAPDPNESFHCSPITKSKGFTLLMKLILMTNNAEAVKLIKKILANNPEEINKKMKKDGVL